jgi:hypothetical protein
MILSGCVNEDEKKDEVKITKIEIIYQIKIEYSGSESYSVQVPVFIDEHSKVLELNDRFKTITGDVTLNINYTEKGPSLLLDSDGSFFIEINESFKDKSEFTENTAGLSMIENVKEEYWIHSTVPDQDQIKLTFIDIRIIYDNDGSVLLESRYIYEGNLEFGWSTIEGELYEHQKE